MLPEIGRERLMQRKGPSLIKLGPSEFLLS